MHLTKNSEALRKVFQAFKWKQNCSTSRDAGGRQVNETGECNNKIVRCSDQCAKWNIIPRSTDGILEAAGKIVNRMIELK